MPASGGNSMMHGHSRGRGSVAGMLAALAVVLAAPPGFAAGSGLPHPVLVSADLREGMDLGGAWHQSIDPFRSGVTGTQGAPPGRNQQRYADLDVESVERSDPGALFEFDMQRSPVVQLPGSWIAGDPTLRRYEGLVWYQRTFAAHPRTGERAFLRFAAVDYSAVVYVNGSLAGRHAGGFTPFAIEVTRLLRAGENQITIGVDSQRTTDSVPPPVTDWENYGGITRSIRLLHTPDTFIDDAWVRLTRDGRIAATVRLDGPAAAGQAVSVLIPGARILMRGATGPDGTWSGSITAPKALGLWSPEHPTLYDLTVQAGGDVLRDRVGFRTIAVRGDGILLNGRPIFLRGVSLHEEELGKDPARSITPAAARALLSEAKYGLHANFIRLAHYPHSEVTTRMADEMGLLVWSEIPVYWLVNFASPETLATARQMQVEAILRDRNRASIIFWSVGNETPVKDVRTTFLSTLVDDARALDDSRLITAALFTSRHEKDGHLEMVVDDPLVAKLDVMAVNTYNGWYGNDPLSAVAGIGWSSSYGKPLILSEFGADALAGYHDDGLHKFSEEFQAEYYRQTLAMAAKIPFLRGMSPWILKDFRSPRRQHPVYQQGWNRKGLLSETGQRKLAFEVLAQRYRALEAEVPAR